jgi:pimeloyl-ACP methyl ester carboxylesterase
VAPPLIAHRLAGTGEPLLLLNGGFMSMAAWDPIATRLERRFRVLRCDFRGQLLSPGPPPATLAGHLEEVVALLDHVGTLAVHVVGASFGAMVGLLLAARHPGRVRSLVAITAADRVPEDQREPARLLREACRAAARGDDGGRVFDLIVPGTFSDAYVEANREALAERRRQVAALPAWWFEGAAGLLGALEALDLRGELPNIRARTLVLAAEGDRTFPPACSRSVAEGVAGARLTVLPGSGHALVAERPAEVVEQLLAFLTDGGVT